MIFDNEYVTDLVVQWNKSRDQKILDLVIEHSMSLVEVIVSIYDPIYREDLIQEACLRVQYALPFFDQSISNLYNYLTTVIRNICITYLRQQYRYSEEYDIDLHVIEAPSNQEPDDILSELIERNRKRFPSFPSDTIDLASEYIFEALLNNSGKRQLIDDLCKIVGCEKAEANSLYISTIIFLRYHYRNFFDRRTSEYDEEYSIKPDIAEIFGVHVAETLCTILAGMQIKFP
jgi:RNA polymerase sigma factor (sigma-70 family)